MKKIILILISISTLLSATTGKQIAEDLEINPQKKVIKQWKRVFKNNFKMKRYGINTLNKKEKEKLLKYLIKNAKDAELEAK